MHQLARNVRLDILLGLLPLNVWLAALVLIQTRVLASLPANRAFQALRALLDLQSVRHAALDSFLSLVVFVRIVLQDTIPRTVFDARCARQGPFPQQVPRFAQLVVWVLTQMLERRNARPVHRDN